MSIDILKSLFEHHFHAPVERVTPLQGELGGSGRKIIRLSAGPRTAIGILYDVREENAAFLSFSKHFRCHNLPVPEIYAEDLDHGAYLEEDLGDTTLFEFLSKNRQGGAISPAVVEAYKKVVAILPRFQVEAGRDLDYSVCYPISSFDRQSIAWDLNYFKYYFLRLAGIPFNEHSLEADFNRLTDFLLSAPRDYFLYRDFQSRNILPPRRPALFRRLPGWPQRRPPIRHRLAPLRRQSRSPSQPSQDLLYDYLRALEKFIPINREAFLRFYYAYVYVRIMQALGAYGFRGFYERKVHFLQSVPYALKNLRWLLHHAELPIAFPALMAAFQGMLASEKLQSLATDADNLVVRVFSFSFHQGLPERRNRQRRRLRFRWPQPPQSRPRRPLQIPDRPGRPGNRLSQPTESVHQFLASVLSLVDASIASYQSRGFKNLMVSFGCTGGQHRSVFLAEQLAKRLRNRPGIEVQLRHLGLENLRK